MQKIKLQHIDYFTGFEIVNTMGIKKVMRVVITSDFNRIIFEDENKYDQWVQAQTLPNSDGDIVMSANKIIFQPKREQYE